MSGNNLLNTLMTNIININEANINEYPQAICFINPKHEYYPLKLGWLQQQFKHGLGIKLFINPADKKVAGFIEYIPGEYAARGVEAKDYLLIHCVWMNPNKVKLQGHGSELVKTVIEEAKNLGKKGVAVITSDASFMSKKELFLKNNFKLVEELEKFQLLTFELTGTKPTAKFKFDPEKLKQYQGWHIFYAKQCPWVARSIHEIEPVIKKYGLQIKITEFESAAQMQEFGTIYSVFNLIKDGKLLADRYISATRFQNIVKAELGK